MKDLLKHPRNIRSLLLFIGDILIMTTVLVALMPACRFIRTLDVPSMFTKPLRLYALYPSILVYLATLYVFGMYEKERHGRLDIFVSSLSSAFVAFAFMFAMAKVFRPNKITIIVTFAFFVISAFLIYYWRVIFRRVLLRSRKRMKKRALFMGVDSITDEIVGNMRHHDYKVLGIVDVDESCGKKHHTDLKTVGTLENLSELIHTYGADILVTALEQDLPLSVVKQIYEFKFQGIEVYDSAYFYEILARKVAIKQYLENDRVPFLGMDTFSRPISRNMKRLINVVCSLSGLIVLSPLLIFIAILIKVTSKGPVFFTQQRVGFQESPFRLIKFRTMVTDAELENGPQWSHANDDRVTGVGKLLRKTRLDELPQLINVLKGDMNFIGPRPIRRHFADIIEEQMPFYSLRFSIKPGLTGWAQVNYHYGGSVEGHIEKFQYDLYYVKYASFLLDLFIILKTARTVFSKKAL